MIPEIILDEIAISNAEPTLAANKKTQLVQKTAHTIQMRLIKNS